MICTAEQCKQIQSINMLILILHVRACITHAAALKSQDGGYIIGQPREKASATTSTSSLSRARLIRMTTSRSSR